MAAVTSETRMFEPSALLHVLDGRDTGVRGEPRTVKVGLWGGGIPDEVLAAPIGPSDPAEVN